MSIKLGILASSQQQAAPLLLDVYPGAAAAYSLRKLRTAYAGPSIRVWRPVTNTQTDIGFVNGVLDTAALLTFAGGLDARVVTWYDQSGNSNNATQAINASPAIVLSGVLQTINGKPCIKTGGGAEGWMITNPIAANTNISIFMTAKGNSLATAGPLLGGSGAPTAFFGCAAAPDGQFALGAGLNSTYNFVTTVPNYATTNYTIFNVVVNSTNYYIYQNNNTFTQTNLPAALNNPSYYTIGRYFGAVSDCVFSELVFYKSDQSSNRTGIVNNTNSFYTIF
jgi:hypothetical protein